jgi:DNA primase
MSQRYSPEFLYRLRNEVPINTVIRVLQWPHKQRDGCFRFLCPHCREFNTATNPETNLGRCFHCEKNFNPIDFVIRVQSCDFLEAVDYLTPLLSSTPLPGAS